MKKNDQKEKPQLEIKPYEEGTIQLIDGTLFDPIQDSENRWIVTRLPESYSFLGTNCVVIYELTSGEWIKTKYAGCNQEHGNIWRSEDPPCASKIAPIEVAHFFLDNQFSMPQSLRQVYNDWLQDQNKPIQEPDARPVEYWIGNAEIKFKASSKSHEPDIKDHLEKLCKHLLDLYHRMENWEDASRITVTKDFYFIAHYLFLQFPVDSDHWDWSNGTVPPEMMDILDIDWPDEISSTKTLISKLRDLIQGPILCLAASQPISLLHIRPNNAEEQIAIQLLIDHHSEIRVFVQQINQNVRKWIANLNQAAENEHRKVLQEAEPAQPPEATESSIAENPPPQLPLSDEQPRPDAQPELQVERDDRGILILRVVPDGFYFNGTYQRLPGKPLDLLLLMAQNTHGAISFRSAVDKIWFDTNIENNAVNQAVTKIRKAIRSSLSMTTATDPIPKKGQGKICDGSLDFNSH